ncbi:acyltransferase family protein [Thermomonospora cellulosilytica]|uniref:Peptidoglycan/LPS O-acetylase OafA/YrhL n=1 Tax=Thermomonospora cellulosilytica TaxID=1411118 RepID=A0A7W3RCD7_9ACTN|nr:acyltransferase [Thermomonospora cellulosilytica]MBA9007739.1 peptidoglycan/LPS O-acetylase OafA/YrhL [Thermomonospora cellulosilytica]
MRFIAGLLVFLTHALIGSALFASNFQMEYMGLIIQGGWAALVYFFVLSGFVMTWARRPSDTAGTFWRRRAFRVFPNYLVTLVAYIAVLGLVLHIPIQGRTVLVHLLALQSFVPDLENRIAFNPPAWSLSAELFFYLCFPVLIRLVDRIRPERLWAWAGGVVAACFVTPLLAPVLLPPSKPIEGLGWPELEMWVIQQFPPIRMLEFVLGMILAKIVMSGRRIPLNFGAAVGIFVAVYAVSPLIPERLNMAAIHVVPIGLIILTAASRDSRGRSPGWLGSRLMVKLGDLSFAFYIWHYMIVVHARQWLGTPEGWSTPVGFAVLGLLFAATLAAAWLQFTLIENPMYRRFATSRRRRTLEAAPVR